MKKLLSIAVTVALCDFALVNVWADSHTDPKDTQAQMHRQVHE
jgi:hypothetical protein